MTLRAAFRVVILVACGLVAACAGSVTTPPYGPIMLAMNRTTFPPDTSVSDESRLAVFHFVRGLPRAEAIQLLEADGFTCDEATCRLRRVGAETWLNALGPIRAPGPRRSWTQDYEVRLVAEPVISPDDVEALVSDLRFAPA